MSSVGGSSTDAEEQPGEAVGFSSVKRSGILRMVFGFVAIVVVVVVVIVLAVFVPRWNSTSGEKLHMQDRGATAQTVFTSSWDAHMNTSLMTKFNDNITTRAIPPPITSSVPRSSSASDMSLGLTTTGGPDHSTRSAKVSEASPSSRKSFASTSASAVLTTPRFPQTSMTRASLSPAKPTDHTTSGRGRIAEPENRTDEPERPAVSPADGKQVNRGLSVSEGPLTTKAHGNLSSARDDNKNSTDATPAEKIIETAHGASSVNLTATFNGSGDPLPTTRPPAALLGKGDTEDNRQATLTTSAINVTEPVHKSRSANTTEDRPVAMVSVAMTDIGTGIAVDLSPTATPVKSEEANPDEKKLTRQAAKDVTSASEILPARTVFHTDGSPIIAEAAMSTGL
ncbi:mucin-2-like isoform X2 [Ornithodoros turicata]|uniref:mucin-2-like isoform X2 n=1 Tax=Ornithodoros turicata TaxID=34597 RepID=UPI003138B4C4